jgi:hypothetical protein
MERELASAIIEVSVGGIGPGAFIRHDRLRRSLRIRHGSCQGALLRGMACSTGKRGSSLVGCQSVG